MNKERNEQARILLDKLQAEMLKNNNYDNRLPILDTVKEIVSSGINWNTEVIKRHRETYITLIRALQVHILKPLA